MTEALIAFAGLLFLAFLRIPIAFAMAIVGFIGIFLTLNERAAFAQIASVVQDSLQYTLSVVPLFILMGNFVTKAGLSRELYHASYAFLGHRRGGLAMATIVACGGFSAICGSSLATAATMAKVAMPSMRQFNYDDSLAAGSIAAGGTLGILIPPSVVLVIYGLIADQNIGALFAAGVIPGLVGILFYLGAVKASVWLKPEAGPAGPRCDWTERLTALRDVWGVLLLFGVVMGGIYGGVFTPTEAAGVGAFGAFVFALVRKGLTFKATFEVLLESARTTGMIFTVLIGALIFSQYINLTGLPVTLTEMISGAELHPMLVIMAILVIYLLLGCVLESLSMILLTVPVFYPVVAHLGFDMVWFGIIVVVVTEISLITPPVGLNVFVLRGVLPDVSTGTVFRGVTPFWIADIFRLLVLVFVPGLSLFLPNLFY